ncbi:hypothetical protein [Phaeobacter sp. Ax4a-4a]|uniref:hypothetical protein n=1 Tax=Phaeobacter sp. Ax4a-4a TaxID=3112437 RepID=UPI003A868172
MEYDVKRQHVGDRNYEAGDTRVARPDDVAHLVASGVLTEKAAVVPKNKALKVPSNKAK